VKRTVRQVSVVCSIDESGGLLARSGSTSDWMQFLSAMIDLANSPFSSLVVSSILGYAQPDAAGGANQFRHATMGPSLKAEQELSHRRLREQRVSIRRTEGWTETMNTSSLWRRNSRSWLGVLALLE
jgi:hypothetical protein